MTSNPAAVESPAVERPVFPFGAGSTVSPLPGEERLGGKGHHLCVMSDLGLPVPPGFILETELCRRYSVEKKLPGDLPDLLTWALADLGRRSGRSFWSEENPLLVSVRSGSVVSMPGMLETILNVGLNDRSVEGLADSSGNPRFAWDSYRRLVTSFGTTVHGIPRRRFDELFESLKRQAGLVLDREVDAEGHREAVSRALALFEAVVGKPFPQDPMAQLHEAIEAVLRSWWGARAVEYRRYHGIPDADGTAVTVQAMVFGNRGYASGSGVAFTRNPSVGTRGLYVDFLWNAQGDDIVSGGVDPDSGEELLRYLPGVHQKLLEYGRILENHFRDMQDMEYTVEEGGLYLLQTRRGKRTALAAVQIALDLAEEGIIDRAEALRRIRGIPPDAVRQPELQIPEGAVPLVQGEVASIGSVSGRVALSSEAARKFKREGAPVVLVRPETRTEDLEGIIQADAIVTSRGGRTSHAAVVARHLGKACVVGCSRLEIDEGARVVRAADREIREGEWISVDGRTGGVYAGRFESRMREEDPAVEKARAWARELGLSDHPLLGAGSAARPREAAS
ncbi:MAG: pyruvate, phosphate dikinase [Planctomycetota bacterium]